MCGSSSWDKEKTKINGIKTKKTAVIVCGIFTFSSIIINKTPPKFTLWDKKGPANVLTLRGDKSVKNIPLNILLFGD